MTCVFGPMFNQAASQRSPDASAQRIFTREAAAVELRFEPSQHVSLFRCVAPLAETTSQRHHETKTILQIPKFRLSYEPVVVDGRVASHEPRERFHNARIEIVLHERGKKHLSRVFRLPLRVRTQIRKPGIAKGREVPRQGFGWIGRVRRNACRRD